jgi:two-component system OmpR family sensor kinase
LNKVEIESFLKSFLLFFLSLGSLLVALFIIDHEKETHLLDEKLLTQMRVCSFDLKCTKFDINFIEKNSQELYTLYKDATGLKSYYSIPKSEIYIMQFSLDAQKYKAELDKIENKEIWNFSIILGILFFLSILFSIYALYPLRNALILTHEFIKDILHDINTPLSSLRLNSSMLKKEFGENTKIARIEQSVQNIIDLQQHLRAYLKNHSMQKEELKLDLLLQERIALIKNSYPDIKFTLDISNIKILSSKDTFNRIIDNILVNAAKYNKKNGFVHIFYNAGDLHIEDSGKGIKNPKKVFERFYKEQERGIGIGLHIVKKLCDEAGIKISLESELNKGTTFRLNLSELIVH